LNRGEKVERRDALSADLLEQAKVFLKKAMKLKGHSWVGADTGCDRGVSCRYGRRSRMIDGWCGWRSGKRSIRFEDCVCYTRGDYYLGLLFRYANVHSSVKVDVV
jgi:hypothetical protein